MAKKVIWTKQALDDKLGILEYWNNRNKSNVYSKKLDKFFRDCVKGIAKFPSLGRPTKRELIKYLIEGNNMIFYKETLDTIYILEIWDTRQDPKKLKYEL